MKNYQAPHLAGIFIYPIKSLDGVAVNRATILKSGALARDREFAILDEKDRFVNGKRNAKVHQLRSNFDTEAGTVSLQIQGTEDIQVFHLDQERSALEAWLSNYFDFPVKLMQNSLTGFPDDPDASGPTVISTATLEEVASWFAVSVSEMRRRLRANIEIGGVPPFWEDRLFAEAGDILLFQIGDVLFEGINPCQRCVVPTRDSFTGEVYPLFQKIFSEQRKATLPEWVTSSRFNHFYRLSVNTRIPASTEGKILQLGDDVKILGVRQ